MPIKTLQQQQAQVGRIRIGQQVPSKNGKTRPEKLDRFRFTTPSEQLAAAVAGKYGGTVEHWTPEGRPAEFEVVSEARTIPVLVPPRPVSQWFEMWSGAGCVRRCDGETETLSGDACKCPFDAMERADLAAKGNACKATTRLKVMLPEIPGIGVWRLDSHGYYAAIELPQTAEFLGAVTEANGYIRATLALEQRQVKRPGVGIRTFMVPALHVDVTPEALMAGAGTALAGPAAAVIAGNSRQAALPAGSDPAVTAQRERAQALAEQVLVETDPDRLRSLYATARTESLLTIDVADTDAVISELGQLIIARGQTLAEASAPAGDIDSLWQQVVALAAERDNFDLEADFYGWSGVETAVASAEQMAGYLERLRSQVVPA